MIQISTGNAIILILAFLGCVAAFGKILLVMFTRQMDIRMDAQDAMREEQIETLRCEVDKASKTIEDVSRTLPLEYVRREDWIRFSASIDAKLDRLAALIMGAPRARS